MVKRRLDSIGDMQRMLRDIDTEIALTLASFDMVLSHPGPITPAMRGSLKERRESWIKLLYGEQGEPVDVANDL